MSPSAAIAIAAAVAVAFVVLLGTVALLLLFLRRRPDLAPDPDASSAPRLGLDPSVLRSLPISVSAPGDPTECAVCISEVSQGEKLRILPACGHAFHLHCVDTWFRSHSTCPLCRRPVGPTCEALGVISGDGYSTDLPNLPTNVLFWGNLDRVSTGCGGSTLRDPSSGPSAGAGDDAPARAASDAEGKSPAPAPPPVSARMRSFRRFLSRDKRVAGCSCEADVEQGEADTTAAAGE